MEHFYKIKFGFKQRWTLPYGHFCNDQLAAQIRNILTNSELT